MPKHPKEWVRCCIIHIQKRREKKKKKKGKERERERKKKKKNENSPSPSTFIFYHHTLTFNLAFQSRFLFPGRWGRSLGLCQSYFFFISQLFQQFFNPTYQLVPLHPSTSPNSHSDNLADFLNLHPARRHLRRQQPHTTKRVLL